MRGLRICGMPWQGLLLRAASVGVVVILWRGSHYLLAIAIGALLLRYWLQRVEMRIRSYDDPACEGSGARRCPRCAIPLRLAARNEVAIDRCASCQGEFYDRGEVGDSADLDASSRQWLLQNLLPHVRLSSAPSAGQLACPACSRPMRSFVVSAGREFEIDVCPGCSGTWLDRGEPAALKDAVAQGKLRAAATLESNPLESRAAATRALGVLVLQAPDK